MAEKNEALAGLQRAARKEAKRLMRLLEAVPTARRAALKPVAENTAWMKIQLDRARELIAADDIITEYDNGGGQTGIREHPAYKAYEALWKAYIAGIGRIVDAIPVAARPQADAEPEEMRPQTMLEIIQARREKQA